MSTAINGPVSEKATSAIDRFLLVSLSGGEVVVTTAATDKPYGSTVDGGSAGDEVPVECRPVIVYLTASAAIAKGAELSPAAGGKVVTHAGTATHYYAGRALEAASADGDIIACLIYQDGRAA